MDMSAIKRNGTLQAYSVQFNDNSTHFLHTWEFWTAYLLNLKEYKIKIKDYYNLKKYYKTSVSL